MIAWISAAVAGAQAHAEPASAPAAGATSAPAASVPAETPPAGPLRVGISPFAPFVLGDRDPPAGFSIDLWHQVSVELGVEYRFVRAPGVAAKLDQLARGDIDVAIGGITLTREREELVDFTHPSVETGLGILIRAGDVESPGFFARLRLGGRKWGLILGFLALIVISGHLVWWAERGRDAFNDKYMPGVFEGMYWAIVTASTVGYGDKAPVRWPGRLVASLVIVIALPLFALFTAELASTIVVAEIQSRIDGPEDLTGKRVGVVRGTASAEWAASRGLGLYQWDRAEEVYAALEEGMIDAVVYDAPNLQYYAQNQGRGRVQLVGGQFLAQNLGIAVREGSPLRERINRALLELNESGEIQRLRVQWFGNSD